MKEQIEKQAIEEMVKTMCIDRKLYKTCKSCKVANPNTNAYCRIDHYAENLYNAGYRKQSEGEWERRIFIIFDSEKFGYTCSECNTTWDTETKCCPNCGAKMKGGAE